MTNIASTHPRTRVRVQHTDAIVSAGLSLALHQYSEFEVCEDSGAGADLVICDYDTAMTLTQCQRASRQSASGDVRLLVLTSQDREQSVRRAIEGGVHGYLLSGSKMEDFFAAVRTVARGQRFLSPEVAQRMADSMTREALTRRESEVLGLLAEGYCNKDVARRLDIALGTVKAHVKAIMAKLDVTSRTQAVSIAAQRGLVALTQVSVH